MKKNNQNDQKDHVDAILRQWKTEKPDLQAQPMGIFGRLHRIHAFTHQTIKETLAGYGLSIDEFDVLATLRRSGAPYRLTPTQLYTAAMLSSGAMTNRLDKLERKQLIQRQPDENDRRSVIVALTDEGMELIDKAVESHVETEWELLKQLEGEDQEQLADLLRKWLVTIENKQ
ncbi:Transcriptional regulator [Hahella chejuensis KCTC 2396]|uniref:Transcriptional regulator n=1 Tax=Hahella chejuensis (strain KCTC 2396) TaxID=349521 RepID=Q2S7S4_HAHCH|nr:MarR family transcriptional regulator [Hahella chejuensis]ABC33300.1 Transcriptional regulator [Hahella chejuensis KCTC 2396]